MIFYVTIVTMGGMCAIGNINISGTPGTTGTNIRVLPKPKPKYRYRYYMYMNDA